MKNKVSGWSRWKNSGESATEGCSWV